MTLRPTVWLALFALASLAAPPVSAQRDEPAPTAAPDGGAAPEPTARQRALDLFEESVGPYREGRFDEAIRLLEQAYELFPEPVLLYNLARAYEGKGELATAADKYEQYLRLEPTASDRGAIEQRVLNLRRVLARRRVSQRSPDPGPRQASSPNARPEAGGRWLPWALVVTGGAVSASGGVLGLLARQKESDARSATNHRDASASWDEAENRATLANIAFVAGGALIVGGSVWLVLSRSGDSVTLGISPNGVVARGSL